MSEVRRLAWQVLAELNRSQQPRSLQHTLPAALQRCPDRDRSLLTELVQGTARRGLYLKALMQPLLRHPINDARLEALILLGLYQIFHTRIPEHASVSETVNLAPQAKRAFVNAILRSSLRRREELLERSKPFEHSHPQWLIEQFEHDWPNHLEAFIAANQNIPGMTLRVNRRVISRDDYRIHLQEAGIENEPLEAPQAIALQRSTDPVQLPGYDLGWFSIQDMHAQLACQSIPLKDGDRILDACAAPGGKTSYLLEQAQDLQVLALEVDAERIKRLGQNLERLNLPHATLQHANALHPNIWWNNKPFDTILIDAPCSGTGVIRRHPDILWLRQAADLDGLCHVQEQLLNILWPLLNPGGHLIYMTCSVLHRENHLQIQSFLNQHPDALCLNTQDHRPGHYAMPGRHDGFYHALLQKLGNPANA